MLNRFPCAFFLAFFLLQTCTPELADQRIPLFNDITFEFQEDEAIVALDTIYSGPYQRQFNFDLNAQIPLYRVLVGPSYTIHLGIPYRLSLSRLEASRASLNHLQMETNKKQYYSQRMEGGQSLIEYAQVFDDDSMVFIGIIVNKPDLDISQFSKDAIEKRLFTSK